MLRIAENLVISRPCDKSTLLNSKKKKHGLKVQLKLGNKNNVLH